MSVIIPSTPLPRDFYARDTVTVARELIGKMLVRVIDADTVLAGIIVETEGYRSDEPACHAYKGKKTARTAPLFGPVGHTYVYFIYGTHFCVNIVSRDASLPAGGVLIRALEPVAGIEYMQQRRGLSTMDNLTNGPGKITQALSISRDQIGIDVTTVGSLYVAEGRTYAPTDIVATPRIGISQAREHLWRFCVQAKK